ncbi:beta-N-acetylglucosaminidase domain-containing protein [Sphingomonas psychrotolerans]|uniref:Beta-N-acetylglucosaminidase domain-containing protein n=1 Tax=Sphingomonas psychrotolerans TaxID=1327635 RepID=A0ABU3MZW8_9SPHN|nr:beta-N-acetylglucosaminidase domain-containing protein [Sphingomonas psychrotolerans]MDT8757526.1 beta-N-acetylglucosaminidase domain-containing protein [Sphingomonas psychrotolerans]
MRVLRSLGHLSLPAVALMLSTPAAAQTLPAIFPAPVSAKLTGGTLPLGKSVTLVQAGPRDPETEALVRRILIAAGVQQIRTATRLPARLDATYVVLGTGDAPGVQSALARTGATLPTQAEGYALASTAQDGGTLIVLAGKDADGLYHAAHTLRQIATGPTIAAVTVADYPAMPVRGTIEGFYGKHWSMAERASHIGFLAGLKANTYIYSPKDEPFARDRWREDYPAETLKALGGLVETANRQHVNFVYAISPGPSICYSSPADLEAIRRKFNAMRGIGVRSFYVALDDIEYTKWNCPGDEAMFGAPGQKAAASAQAKLLNAVQADLVAAGDRGSLIMVPTEYYNATESPYKATLRKELDPRVVVQWTGTDVVPPSISVNDARNATKAFGRKTLLWDNYPVNDFRESAGRLLLAPYARREAGLSAELSGIVSNPMNQEAASRPAVMGLVAFAWNDRGYDADRTWTAAARYLAGNDPQVTAALLAFFDTQHLAPTFGSHPWQPQAPRLKALIDQTRDALAVGDAAAQAAALSTLGAAADELAAAPDLIRAGVVVPGFVAEARPWLEAAELWGRALKLTVSGLTAALGASPGSGDAASGLFIEAQRLAKQAEAINSIPGAVRFDGPIKIADGVLDTFVADAPTLVHVAGPARPGSGDR